VEEEEPRREEERDGEKFIRLEFIRPEEGDKSHPYTMLVDKVEVRYHNLYGFECRGIFAKETIKAGEMIWTYKEGTEILRTYHKHQIDALPPSPAKMTICTVQHQILKVSNAK
ncbi:hypothetical protein NGA_0547300, partial [Nannochloropsis gaditana CCMP526]|uniref:uncharacterized protein n=1 Tax=Nannochloropsis gaditana (strain CCMP526) TaxID=1093141 RepID=UPI00029F7AD0